MPQVIWVSLSQLHLCPQTISSRLGTLCRHCFAQMDPVTGALPYSGPPLNFQGSDTYHAWTLIGTHNYYLYSGDIDWLQTVWANYVRNNIRLSAR